MEIAIFIIAGTCVWLLGKVIAKDARIKALKMNLETVEYRFRHELEQHNNTKERMKAQAKVVNTLSGSPSKATRYPTGLDVSVSGFVGGAHNIKPDPALLGTNTGDEVLWSNKAMTEEQILRLLGLNKKEPPTDTSLVDWLENKNGK